MDDIALNNKDINTNSEEDTGAALLRTILLERSDVPYSHNRTADNFVVIKRMSIIIMKTFVDHCHHLLVY